MLVTSSVLTGTCMFIVQIYEELGTGDGYYRFDEPARVMGSREAVLVVDVHHMNSHLFALMEQCDVLLCSFFSHLDLFDLMERRRRQGKVTVFETADYYHEPQPWNPIAPYWLDPDVIQEHERYIASADAVQTSTQRLAELWQSKARRIVVFANHLSVVPPLLAAPARPLTIGWAGSQGHLADWYQATCYLQPWLEQHPAVQVAVMTHRLARDFLKLPPERYRFFDAGSIADYQRFLGNLDIGLVPLLPNEWNRSRSDIKFLEYAAHGVVGIYSQLGPYNQTVQDAETGLLCGSMPEMITALDRLAGDAALRLKLRAAAHDYVSRHRVLEQHIDKRLDFYRSLLQRETIVPQLAPELLSGAKRQANYLRLSNDAAGQKLRMAGEQGGAAAIQLLAELLQAAPQHLLARRELARRLNDAKEPQKAQELLLAISGPWARDGRVLSERGRAAVLAGDIPAGKDLLLAAVRQDPQSVPAWDYLLRFFRTFRDQAPGDLLGELRERHPLSGRLFFMALPLFPAAEQLTQLGLYLDRITPALTPQQLQAGAVLISRGVFRCCSQQLDEPAAHQLLDRARTIFPASAALAILAGLAAHRRGAEESALDAFATAARLREAAQAYAAEIDERNFLHYFALVGAQLRAEGDS